MPNENKVNVAILETAEEKVRMEKQGEGYVVEAKVPHGIATIQIEYIPEAILTKKVTVPGNIKFLQLKYRSWTNIAEEFSTISYPERIEPFKVSEKHKFELEVVYNNSFVTPNNTLIVFQHKDYPKAHSIYHLNPGNMSIRIDFGKEDVLHELNGQYEMKIVGKFANLEKEWTIGSIVVELSTGTTEYIEPKVKGPAQGKELRHTFTPELVYASIYISLPVAVFLVVLLILFLYSIGSLNLKYNNWPSSSTGKICALIFIVYFSLISLGIVDGPLCSLCVFLV